MSDELRKIPIHRALNRPDLTAGCERKLIIGLGAVAISLIVVALNVVATVVGVVIWIVGVFGLRWMAKKDPYMSTVYNRHRKYNAYYPARSTPWAPSANHRR